MIANKDTTLLLFTDSYPFDSAAEDTFLDPEIPHLLNNFEKIIVFPKSTNGQKRKLPKEIIVNLDFAKNIRKNNVVTEVLINFYYAISSKFFYYEILKKPGLIFHFVNFCRMTNFLGDALQTQQWLLQFIIREKINLDKTIFYTYWCKEVTLGIGYIKLQYPNLILISRAHGVDVYDERFHPPYLPFRPEIFHFLNKVFIASTNGQKYLRDKYPHHASKFEVSKLGINDTNFITKQSEDKKVRIISCSYLVPVKRIELLIRGLKELGEIQKNVQFFWVHIGNGPMQSRLELLANSSLPQNVHATFLGYLPNSDVISFYKNNPLDIFINVSESEGTPLSIIEAQCCGIPVIATAVGGNNEIVTNSVGCLLSLTPQPQEIAEAIIKIMNNSEGLKRKKDNSKKNWDQNYNADKNFNSFVSQIIALKHK